MSEDEFTKLFQYVQRTEKKVDAMAENMATKADMQRVIGLLDAIAKRQEISDDERLVMGHQLNRLDRWTHELAEKIGHKLIA